MIEIKKNSLICCLLLITLCLFIINSVRSQAPEIGITLTWSTNTYVPSGYPGKALPARGSIIEVVANIDSLVVNPAELDYRWFLNEHLQSENSGQGKNIFRFPVGWQTEKDQSIKVEIREKRENFLDSAYLAIKIVKPEIILQPSTKTDQGIKKQILPLNSSAASIIKNYQFYSEQEIDILAQPYFFNVEDMSELDYQWSFGDKEATPESSTKPNLLLLKIAELNKAVSQNLNILVEDKKNPIQRAETTAKIEIIPLNQ